MTRPLLKRLLTLSALFLLSSCRQEAEGQATTAATTARGCVWVADFEGRPGQLFLCGTIHVLRRSDYPLARGYDHAYQQAQRLLFELPPGAAEAPEFSARLMELGRYPAGQTLEPAVGPETWARLAEWAKARGKSTATFQPMRPWLSSLVITSEEFQKLGASNSIGADQHYEERARADGKPGQGLETVELQLRLFSQLTAEQQKLMLDQTLEEVRTMAQEYDSMVRAWKEGNLDTLHNLINREAEKHPELLEIFINNRNRAWVPPLLESLKKGENVMVLVGAGHLGGPQGVISLLRAQGCRVRHVSEVMPPPQG